MSGSRTAIRRSEVRGQVETPRRRGRGRVPKPHPSARSIASLGSRRASSRRPSAARGGRLSACARGLRVGGQNRYRLSEVESYLQGGGRRSSWFYSARTATRSRQLSAFRRGGRWVEKFQLRGIQHWVPGGPWSSRRAAQEAERRYRDRLEERRTQETCADFAERWLAEWPRPEASTRQLYAQAARRFAADFGPTLLGDVERLCPNLGPRRPPKPLKDHRNDVRGRAQRRSRRVQPVRPTCACRRPDRGPSRRRSTGPRTARCGPASFAVTDPSSAR